MARGRPAPKTEWEKKDIRFFDKFYKEHLQTPLRSRLCAYVFADPPPYAIDDDGNTLPTMWRGNEHNIFHRRGDWFADLAASDKEAALMQDMRHVTEEYRRLSGANIQSISTASEMGIRLPMPESVMKEHAPSLFGEPFPAGAFVYVHCHYANSMLPRRAQEQHATSSISGAIFGESQTEGDCVPLTLSARGAEKFPERVTALQVWSARMLQRRHEALCAMAFLDGVGNLPTVSTESVLKVLPWIAEVAKHAGLEHRLAESAMPWRGVGKDFAMFPPSFHPMPDAYRAWRVHAGAAVEALSVVFPWVHATVTKAIAAHMAWTPHERPNNPCAQLVAAWDTPVAPEWLKAWLLVTGEPHPSGALRGIDSRLMQGNIV